MYWNILHLFKNLEKLLEDSGAVLNFIELIYKYVLQKPSNLRDSLTIILDFFWIWVNENIWISNYVKIF